MDTNQSVTEFENKIKKKSIKVGVIGIGYVGLPLSVSFCSCGFSVVSIDVVQDKVDQLNQGVSPVKDVTSEEVKKYVDQGLLKASSDYRDLADCDAISICVPTPLRKTKDPDISFILDASYRISEVLKKGGLVVLESTTYPGTTHERILPIFEEKGFKLDEDFYLAYSPERIDPGNEKYHVKNTPKVVGGLTPSATAMAQLLYGAIIDKIVCVSSTQSAEMVKLLENTFRAVNIGLVNEIAIMCSKLKIDTWEVIKAAATKPFGFMPFYPGPGLGGHCIPVDPHYLNWKLKTLNYNARFIELAGEINSSMPQIVVELVTQALNSQKKAVNGAKVMVLGVAYKQDIDDVRESPALDILGLLMGRGAEVTYHDPYVPHLTVGEHTRHTMHSLADDAISPDGIKNFDCVVVVTNHSNYNFPSILKNAALVVDTRNASEGIACEEGRLFRL